MKNFIALLATILFYTVSFAQDKPAPINRSNPGPTEERLTESDKFLKRAGTLIEKRFYYIGKTRAIAFEVIKLKDLNSNDYYSALSLESKDITGLREGKAVLDEDEVDGFLKTLKLLQSVVKTQRDTYSEVTYKSRGYFTAGAYYDEKRLRWKPFVQLLNYSDKTWIPIDDTVIGEMIVLVENAKIEMKKEM